MTINREWAMPSADTFTIAPIANLLDRYLQGAEVIIDPFARNSKRGTITNDLNPETTAMHHKEAKEFLAGLDVLADAVLFDPPYSPRQISEAYQAVGLSCGMKETQNAVLYSECRNLIAHLTRVGGIVISFGWNSAGMGKERGFEMVEILMVCHGGAHNDTIVVVEKKNQGTLY